MHRFITILFALLIAMLTGSETYAAAKKNATKITTDTAAINIKKFDEVALKQYKADKDFNYNGDALNNEHDSLWTQFWNWIWRHIFEWIFSPSAKGVFTRYLLLGLSIAFLVYVILRSLGVDIVRLWGGDSKKVAVPYSESLENIHEINFDSEIERAVAQHNYRLAVRLLYLKCLKELSDSRLIQWQIDKTNSAYLNELTDPAQRQTFSLLTRQFEYAWYGNFLIDKKAFSNISQLFQNFKKQLL